MEDSIDWPQILSKCYFQRSELEARISKVTMHNCICYVVLKMRNRIDDQCRKGIFSNKVLLRLRDNVGITKTRWWVGRPYISQQLSSEALILH